ncbi:MAG: flagellar basal body-associated FliL family protein [Rhodospirillales bacterium]|nr:flagellar basal body-associated FliL family protein [Rhodospirillales bacterium]
MAEDIEDVDVDDDGDEDGEGSSKKGGKKTLLIIVGAVLVVLIGGGVGAWFTGLLDPVVAMLTGAEPEQAVEGEGGEVMPGDVVFLDLPEILVNLNTGGRKSSYLKIRVSLELQDPNDVPRVEGLMTRIMDTFNIYLRELRIDDLKGSAGMYRLREELLARVSAAVAPAQVNDVLFKEMLVQ